MKKKNPDLSKILAERLLDAISLECKCGHLVVRHGRAGCVVLVPGNRPLSYCSCAATHGRENSDRDVDPSS